ncbi:MAG: polysaccharide biosynthesis/export family protein [Candidatus Tectomicrobia bacterium]|uniref:Polysaccharide biosynthesis/export family protein n=1 Tax=Tectimicrobiota bacterium TaxID=2528274 RepID=A0A933LQP5_UNCTE|nr:polysaccharide biosynthesis/export family protein [Candidatus Tectomicrobia bacterium]
MTRSKLEKIEGLLIFLAVLGIGLGILFNLVSCASLAELVATDKSRANPVPPFNSTKIVGLITEETDKSILVSVVADHPFAYHLSNSQEKPYHIRIDLEAADFVNLPPLTTVNKGTVEEIKVLPGGGAKRGGRIEIGLKNKVDYEINRKGDRLVIALPKGQEEASLQTVKSEKSGGSILQTTSLAAARAQDYLIGGKDILEITVYDEPDLTKILRVSRQGTISFPLIGAVKVEGLSPSQLELRLKEQLAAGYLKNPQVNVMVKEYHSKEVSVVGALSKPGVYPLTSPTTVLEMLSLAGGLV